MTSTTQPVAGRAPTPRKRMPDSAAQPQPSIASPAVDEDQGSTMYVYLDNGQVVVVRNVSCMEMSDKTIRLIRDGQTVAEYLRRDVFCASRELICPPFCC